MNFRQNIRDAIRALSANKMRSFLTMLGVIIGVGSVVALLAIGSGTTNMITGQIQGIGSNLITIIPGSNIMNSGGSMAGSSNAHLYYSDYTALFNQVTGIDGFSPLYQSSYPVKYNSESKYVSVKGITPEYFSVRSTKVVSGREINLNDITTRARVALLGPQTVTDLFGNIDPLGKAVKINGVRFEVIGVLEEKGGSIQNSDDVVLIPLETGYDKLFGSLAVQDGKNLLNTISMSAADPDSVNSVMAQAERVIRREHHLKPTDDADFSIMSQNDFLSTLDTVTTTMNVFLGVVAGISLLVGGIGIMNIMLVSVTERTREIGLRKAVGARKDQIMTQFLIETVTMSLVGGLIGILLGVAAAVMITISGLITAQITLGAILLAFFFALAVGVGFGLYPAYRAASLHPIEALRYE